MNTLSIWRSSSAAESHFVEHQLAGGVAAVEQRVRHRPRLLVHLLGHEVVVAVFAGRLEVPRDVQLLEGDRLRPRVS